MNQEPDELAKFRDTLALILDTPDWINEFITRNEELELSWSDISSCVEESVRSRMNGLGYLAQSGEHDVCSGAEVMTDSEYKCGLKCGNHQSWQEFGYTNIDTSEFNLGGMEVEGPVDLDDNGNLCSRKSFNMRRLLLSVITDLGLPVRLNVSATAFHKSQGSFEIKDAGFILAPFLSGGEKSLAVMLNPEVSLNGSTFDVSLWAPLGTWNLSSEPSFSEVGSLVSSALDLLIETELDGYSFDFTCVGCETTARIVDAGSKDRFILASTGECVDCHMTRYDMMMSSKNNEVRSQHAAGTLGIQPADKAGGLISMMNENAIFSSASYQLAYGIHKNERAQYKWL